MKILQIIKGLDIGGKNGGAEQFGLNLSRTLERTRSGVEVTLCAFYRHRSPIEVTWEKQLLAEGILVVYGLEPGEKDALKAFRRIAKSCRDYQIEIAHSHFQVGSLMSLYLKASGSVPVILRTVHTMQEWGDGPVAWIARQVFSGWVHPFVMDAQAGVSKAVVSKIKKYPGARLSRKEPYLIYNGIATELIENRNKNFAIHANLRPAGGEFVIGSVGRLVQLKGYNFLLEAFARFLKFHPSSRLILVGEGNQHHKLQCQARETGITGQVEFVGQVADPIEFIKRMDLFVLPSSIEGLPTVLLEAMACGTPVIATDIPGTRELVENGVNGWLVPASHPGALSKAMVEAYQSPEKCRLFAYRAAKSIDRFTYQVAAKQYAELYRQLLSSNQQA